MLVWIIFTLMTVAAVVCVVWPLSRARPAGVQVEGDDLPFYRDQLRALDRDVAHGLVSGDEAAGSRAEIGRRLIAAADRAAAATPRGSRRARLFAGAAAVTVLIPAVSLALYERVGAPEMGDRPLAARLAAPDPGDFPAAIARVESHLAAHPEDGRGFALLAPIYVRLGRYADAAHAYDRALATLGETAEGRSALGEALVQGADGTVTSEARAAFAKAAADDPKLPQPRFYLGLAAAQDGDKASARAQWTALLADSPADAPWTAMVQARLAALDGTPSGPAASAIASMPDDQRLRAIHGMVDGLASRLQQDGHDAEGWLKLVRAYTVLGEKSKAATALADARRNLASDAAGLARLDGLARELGLEGQG
jgi:cytochrome c-type biogenesis protein CcmH